MLDDVKNILFANKDICYLCKDKIDNKAYICEDCKSKLEWIGARSKIEFKYMDTCSYILVYNRFLRDTLSDFKFNGKNYLYKPLGHIMVQGARQMDIGDHIDLVLYIPSHRRKEALRGYNQAQLLAKYISQSLDIPLSRKNLIKIRKTREQSGLNKIERMSNLKKSFQIRDKREIKGKNILLIDDIITTGVTLEEASRLLLENGARKVTGLTLTSSKI